MQELIVAAGLSFFVVCVVGKIGIPLLRNLHAKQSIREEGPKSHQSKTGTPTMGGLFILLGITITSLVCVSKGPLLYAVLLMTLGHGCLGFIDDFIKAVKKHNLGLTAKQKLVGQFLLAAIFSYIVHTYLHLGTDIRVPGFHGTLELGILFYPFLFLVLVGATNAVNLTDGLDGLAAGTTVIAAGTYAVVCLWLYQNELAIYSVAVAAASLGFLVYNLYPAKVFMGDTGSLALGGALASIAILTKTELLFVVIGGIYVMEALSVILQVLSFKLRGVRIFKMSPIHHHFELSGWSETRVVYTFWAVGIGLAVLAMTMLVYML